MSAAAHDVCDPPVASPELALVDASLAAELRRSLPDPTPALRVEVPVAPALSVDECADLIVGYADESPIDTAVVGPISAPLEMETEGALDLIVGYGGGTAGAETRVSAYPSLPAPDAGFDATEETDVALRRIQERLNVEHTPGRARRLRRRFTIASGIVAGASLAVYGVQVYSGLAQLPSLPA